MKKVIPMEQGIVIEIRGDTILVETCASAMCSGCSAGHTCLLGADGVTRRIWMDNERGAQIGDEVTFDIAGTAVAAAAAVVYLVPVLLLIIGTLLGASAGGRFGIAGDLPLIAGGIAGLLIAVPVSWALSAVMKKKNIGSPRLIDITRKEKTIN